MEKIIQTRLRCWILLIVGLVVTISLLKALAQLAPSVITSTMDIDCSILSIALAVMIGYRVFNALGWRLVLQALGAQLSARLAVRLWLQSEACRWLPGSLWNLGSRAALASHQKIRPATATASVLLELLLTIIAWTLVALVGVVSLGPVIHRFSADFPGSWLVLSLVSVSLAGLIVIWWVRSSSLGQKKLSKLRMQLNELCNTKPNLRLSMRALAYYVGLCIVNGVGLQLTLVAIVNESTPPITTVVGINAIAWIIGFFTVFAPGGVLVREGCIATILSIWMPMPTAVVVAVTWRLVQVVSEILCLVAIVSGKAISTMAIYRQSLSHSGLLSRYGIPGRGKE